MKHYLILLFIFLVGVVCASQLEGQEIPCCQSASGCAVVSSCSSLSPSGGPGTEMTKMINQLGLGSDCGRCKALAAEMDCRGPEWVRQNRNYVVQRTISNAKNLGHRMGPIQRAGVRSLVRLAIRRSQN